MKHYITRKLFCKAAVVESQAEKETFPLEASLEMDQQIRLGIVAGPMKVHEVFDSSPTKNANAKALPFDQEPFSLGKHQSGSQLIHCFSNSVPEGSHGKTLSWSVESTQATYKAQKQTFYRPKDPEPSTLLQAGNQIYFRSPPANFVDKFVAELASDPGQTWPEQAVQELSFTFKSKTPCRTAREKALAACRDTNNKVVVIKGPPGTGKTHLLAEVAGTLATYELRVLICAISHAVVENALNEIKTQFPDLELKQHGKETERGKIVADFSTDLVVGAVNAAAIHKVSKITEKFDFLIIDEAGQVPAFAVAALAPLANHVLLFGDESQLPCILNGAHHPANYGGVSVMHYIKETNPDLYLPLDQTQRMNNEICALIQKHFYPDIPSLQPAPDANAKARIYDAAGNPLPSLLKIQLDHSRPNLTHSEKEAVAVVSYIQQLLTEVTFRSTPEEEPGKLQTCDIAVLTPYRQQVRTITEKLREAKLSEIRVGTVDKMQGQGAKVLIYSLATSNPDHIASQAEWLFQANRWNVAISRAIAHACIIGDISAHLNATPSTLKGLNAQLKINRLLKDELWNTHAL